MHRELEWPVSKATCSYRSLYTMYRILYTIIEGTSRVPPSGIIVLSRAVGKQKGPANPTWTIRNSMVSKS